MDRRRFLRTGALCLAGTALPLPLPVWARRPVRVRGAVRAAGRGLAGVGVSDGLTVVSTAADGTYELLTTDDRPFVQLCLPRGYGIPRNPTGTARLFAPLQPGPGGEAKVVFDLTPLPGGPKGDERHAILLLADVQTQDATELRRFHDETVPDVLAMARSLGEVETFGVSCGDMMFDRLELFPEYERGISRMGLPFFHVVGNHDLDQSAPVDDASTETFSGRFGPRYFSFERGAVHYVVLDDVFWHGSDYLGHLDAEQVRWLQADLGRVEAGRTVVVFLHIPVLGSLHVREGKRRPANSLALTNRELLYRLLAPYRAHVLVGHMHESEHGFEHGVHEHVAGAVCGAWWTGPICADGTPNGYAIYEVAGERVSWRYKTTGKPLAHQMRLYPRGADAKAPDTVLANVWDWDPDWRVLWFEDGSPRGAMARRTGPDPLSVKLHAGSRLPSKRRWVEPFPTAHLFHAAPSRGARTVTVEATDRFGRVSKETLSLNATGA